MASCVPGSSVDPETEPSIGHIIVIPEEISKDCCIYKVPTNLRKLNDGEAYTPQLISIGPFHHNKSIMYKQKQRYLHAFEERITNKKAFDKYKACLYENVDAIRRYYSEPDNLTEDQFVDMILLDSVFILELFLRKCEGKKEDMFTTPWICKSIQRDLLLLENQLPFFILEELYKKVPKVKGLDFLELAFKYFEDYYPHKSKIHQNNLDMVVKNFKSCKHFTDLIRLFYLPEKVHDFTLKDECVLKTATNLNEAGVSFEKVHNRTLLDIKFKNVSIFSWFLCLGCLPFSTCFKARLQIPQLKVLQTTECVLRNLIALEQYHYSDQPFICNYVSLIDSLIHTKEDVELLVDKEIIVHELGSHTELATMINGICKHVVVNCDYYGEITKKLNDHYNNSWKRHMGMLRSVYFRDPWRLSSTIVGVAVFLFAVVNFLRVIGVFHPKYKPYF